MSQSQVMMNKHKIIEPLMLQPISSLRMYLVKQTPTTLTSRRGESLAKDSNCQFL